VGVSDTYVHVWTRRMLVNVLLREWKIIIIIFSFLSSYEIVT